MLSLVEHESWLRLSVTSGDNDHENKCWTRLPAGLMTLDEDISVWELENVQHGY